MTDRLETIIFGGGCFWCTEAVFSRLRGVAAVTSGYAGGHTDNPYYEDVAGGRSGHAEAVKVEYDPSQISLADLLAVFFTTHDPTTLNRQGADVGTQYRSAIFYETDEQKEVVEKFIAQLEKDRVYSDPIVTETKPFSNFFEAEEYHKQYYKNNAGKPYCQLVISPKLEKLKSQYRRLLRPET